MPDQGDAGAARGLSETSLDVPRESYEGREYVGSDLSFGTPIGLNPALACLTLGVRYL